VLSQGLPEGVTFELKKNRPGALKKKVLVDIPSWGTLQQQKGEDGGREKRSGRIRKKAKDLIPEHPEPPKKGGSNAVG